MIKSSTARKIFFLSVILLTMIVLFSLPRLLFPLGISYVLFLVIEPIKPIFIKSDPTKKVFAIVGILFLLFLFVYPLAEIIITLKQESENIQSYFPKIEVYAEQKVGEVQTLLYKRTGIKIEGKKLAAEMILKVKNGVGSAILSFPSLLASILEWSFLMPLFLFFMLKEGRKFKIQFLKIVPNEYFEKTYYLFSQFNKKFGDYIFAKGVEASIVGGIITVVLFIMGYPFALLLGIVAGLTNMVPYLGPILGFIPALVVGLVEQDSQSLLVGVTILYGVANIIDLALVFPILVSKIVNLHPIVVVISVVVGSQFGGVIGMVISTPLAALVQLVFREIYKEIYPKF
ncbi:MAG: AI-2E family transporter [Bacteriovoracaceae bacterium]|nr:AI-2E family transporter [Bacteriovoracaceae bacterium]